MKHLSSYPLLLCLFPVRVLADDFEDPRPRWRQMLAGGAVLDTTLPAVQSGLAANRAWC